MSEGRRRGFTWAVLLLSAFVVIGVFVQVYLIGAYILGGNADALDAHKELGFTVHLVEALAFLAALVAWWRRWVLVGVAFALAALGTVQLAVVDADGDWVRGLHALLALVVLMLAHAMTQRCFRDLGLGRHGAAQG